MLQSLTYDIFNLVFVRKTHCIIVDMHFVTAQPFTEFVKYYYFLSSFSDLVEYPTHLITKNTCIGIFPMCKVFTRVYDFIKKEKLKTMLSVMERNKNKTCNYSLKKLF